MTRQMRPDGAPVIACDGCGREFEYLGYDVVHGFAASAYQGQAVEYCPDCVRARGGVVALAPAAQAAPAPAPAGPAEPIRAADEPERVDESGDDAEGDYARSGGKRRR